VRDRIQQKLELNDWVAFAQHSKNSGALGVGQIVDIGATLHIKPLFGPAVARHGRQVLNLKHIPTLGAFVNGEEAAE
jgi:hypothetical protein